MNTRSHLAPFLLGALALAGSFSAGRSLERAEKWEYKILIDVKEGDANKLSGDGWEYVGYLGQSVRGSGTDETLWRRAGK